VRVVSWRIGSEADEFDLCFVALALLVGAVEAGEEDAAEGVVVAG
jgi:hypothetical protein